MKRLVIVTAALAAFVAVASAPAAAPRLSPGVYRVKITGAAPALLNGTWRLAINSPGFALNRNGAAAVIGTVQIAGNKVTFRDGTGPLACRGPQKAGTYTWRLTGTTLKFTRVNDACVGRRTVLARAFTKIV